MSKNYKKVKGYFARGAWNLKMVRNAVGKWITPEEFTEITGVAYEQA